MKFDHWLIKSEPSTYGIDHLQKDCQTPWTGVRNYQARNFMQQMQVGDPVLFYHSSCAVPGVYGLAAVASAPYPDPTQFDPKSPYYEPRSTKEKPVWYLVDMKFVQKFKEPVTLTEIRENPKLKGLMILQRGSRLSVTPVGAEEFKILSS
jgi:predicted RNA-binding protein with PUA-like domain